MRLSPDDRPVFFIVTSEKVCLNRRNLNNSEEFLIFLEVVFVFGPSFVLVKMYKNWKKFLSTIVNGK